MPRVELTPETLLIEYIIPILKRLSDAERELKELQRISDTPILSAVPSEEWKQIFREIWDIGNELAGADNPEDFFEIEFQKWMKQRGIAR